MSRGYGGPLACNQVIDDFCAAGFEETLTVPVPCGLNSCDRCAAEWLLREVGATARALERRGGNGIVVTVRGLDPGLDPRGVGAFVVPRLKDAVGRLRSRYATFEARATIELSNDDVPNVHVLQWGSSPRKDALRAAFEAADLGTRVDVEPIDYPLAMACYTTKLALYTFRLGLSDAARPLTLARMLSGGRGFEHHHAGVYDLGAHPSKADVRQAGEPYVGRVLEWVRRYDGFDEKLPRASSSPIPGSSDGRLAVGLSSHARAAEPAPVRRARPSIRCASPFERTRTCK